MNAKEQYIRQVKKVLTVPRAKKDEILRDLQEAFDSALEHGETEQDVIERLGSPTEFAGNIEDQRGIKRKRHGKTALIWVLALLSAVLLAVYAASRMMRPPENAIGQADAMTSIQVYSEGSPAVPALLLLLGNLCTDSFETIGARRKALGFIEQSRAVDAKCRSCGFFPLCRGGCRRHRPVQADGTLGRNIFCAGYEKFFAHAAPRLQELARLAAGRMARF